MPFGSFLALLQASNSAPLVNGNGLALIAAAIAFFCRKQPIGGWLLYFFCQVFLGLTLIALTTYWGRYTPGAWSDPADYFLFVISSLSRDLALIAIAAVSVALVRSRDWSLVAALKYALIVYAFITVMKVVVDVGSYPDAITSDTLSLVFPMAYIPYFQYSRRVRRVFLEKSWP